MKLAGQHHKEEDVTMPDSENVNMDESSLKVNPSMEVDSVEGENQAVKVDSEIEINVTQIKVTVNDRGYEQGIVNLKSTASKSEFHFHDLVWGKIRSHPWWPGQILNPSTASNKAKKYFKKDTYLIAYFGDNTFSWNTTSQIKAFEPNFAQLQKQSNLEEFRDAIDCALEEVSRRTEFTLACPCIPEDIYAKIETQIIDNPGIKGEAYSRDDFSFCASSFEPLKPVGFVKALAQQPLGGVVDRLEFSTARAELLAFYRWKGYWQLPQLQFLGGLLECDENIPLLTVAKHGDAALKIDEQVSSKKRKQTSDDSLNLGEKEESLSKWITKNRRTGMKIGKEGSDNKSVDKLISSSSGKKHKMVDSVTDNKAEVHVSPKAAIKSSQIKGTFGVGNIILRVASKLNGSSPILKDTAKKSGKSGSTKKLSNS